MGKYWLFLILLASVSSCMTSGKYVYLRKKTDSVRTFNDTIGYRLKTGDNLMIGFKSLDEKADFIFKRDVIGISESYLYLNSYTINDSGMVSLPVLGDFYLVNKTVNEVTDEISEKVDEYFTESTVFVKLAEYRISLLGEVKKPGSYLLYTNHINILEALAHAGDVTSMANKKKVKILRKSNGQIKSEVLDLTKPECIQSEFFYLKPNDIVYVKPIGLKYFEENISPFRTIFLGVSALIAVFRLTQ